MITYYIIDAFCSCVCVCPRTRVCVCVFPDYTNFHKKEQQSNEYVCVYRDRELRRENNIGEEGLDVNEDN